MFKVIFFCFSLLSLLYLFFFFLTSFFFWLGFLHSKDTKLGVSGLDLVAATHGGSQSEAKVVASVLGRDDAVVLSNYHG